MVNNMGYEQKRSLYEVHLNISIESFFKARPHLERTKENEFLFSSGFRMAWDGPKLIEDINERQTK